MALKPLEVIQEQDNGNFSFEELPFFEGILKNEYILVVGSGIILDRAKFPHNNGDLYTYIVDSINYIYKTDFSNLSEIVQHPIRNMPNAPIHDLLINKLEYDIEDITPELRTILNQRHFRFVFSTTPDHYLETLLTGIWGNDLRIVNFSDHNSLERFSDVLKDTAINKYSQPTLFYVFGKAVKGQSNPVKFLQTDNDAIAYIEKWMKLENDNPIVEFLKAKRVLGIGCNFDDWYFRFFWHILTRDFISRNSVAPYKTDNAVLEEDSSPLGNYLNNMNVCIHTEPWSVLKYIGHMFSKQLGDNTLQTLINQHKLEGKVFISYKTNPDKRAAAILVDELTRQNSFKIWFDDSNLLGGQPYNKKIPEAIRFSKVFIPVLTETVAKTLNEWDLQDLINKNVNDGLPYFIQEWKWAKKVDGITIIPIAFDGYDIKGKEHTKFEQFMYGTSKDEPSGIFLGTPDDLDSDAFNKLTTSIRHALGIYE